MLLTCIYFGLKIHLFCWLLDFVSTFAWLGWEADDFLLVESFRCCWLSLLWPPQWVSAAKGAQRGFIKLVCKSLLQQPPQTKPYLHVSLGDLMRWWWFSHSQGLSDRPLLSSSTKTVNVVLIRYLILELLSHHQLLLWHQRPMWCDLFCSGVHSGSLSDFQLWPQPSSQEFPSDTLLLWARLQGGAITLSHIQLPSSREKELF